MAISDLGLERIKQREGVVLSVYRDSANLPTIGTGHLLTREELSSGQIHFVPALWHLGLTMPQNDMLLRQDVAVAELAVSTVRVYLTQNQFDTLVSFAFNVGAAAFRSSTLYRLLNSGDYAAVPRQLRRWVYSGGRLNPGLVHRRTSEVAQWMGE